MFIVPLWTRYLCGGFRVTSETTEFDLDFSAGLKQEEGVIAVNLQLDQSVWNVRLAKRVLDLVEKGLT